MLSSTALTAMTDPSTISQGRAYVRSGRVVELVECQDDVRAQVQGSELYDVRVSGSSWGCDCPVGVTGALCKHCVAVVIAAEEDGAVDGPADLLSREHLAATQDVAALREEIEHTLAPRRQFYEYGAANAYAHEAEGLVQVIEDLATRPSPKLLVALERSIDLAVRTILRSDNSSGCQGDQVHRLLDAHARAAAALPSPLDRSERRRLATWLHKFRFSGKQDFFEVDVDAYAQALGDNGVAHYRSLVERSAEAGGEDFAVTYARTRLAILDRDAEAIVRVVGGDLTTQNQAIAVVKALDEAGLDQLAVQYATRGLALTRSHRHGALVDRLVADAAERGDLPHCAAMRRDHFRGEPTGTTFAALRSAARGTGTWAQEQAEAENHLAAHRPHDHVVMLLDEDRNDEAWAFATTHPQAASAAREWDRLCARRALTAPADTLPVYRELIIATLRTTDRRAYVTAARTLDHMRSAALAAGREDEFRTFMAETAETNRRRPTCMKAFREYGLIQADRTVV